MNNDFISREALKENGTVIGIVNGQKMKVIPLSFIDNAPTVDAKTTHDVNSAYDRGYITAMKEYSRPHGEWDEIREPFGWDDILSARCSVCGESYPYPEETGFNDIVEMFKYCPNCGAKMEAGDRWKEEEDEE